MSDQPVAVTTDVSRHVSRNVAALVSARAVGVIAGIITLPFVYDELGPVGFGVWVVISGVPNLVALLDLGLGSGVIRRVAATTDDPIDIARTRAVLGIALVWGALLPIVVTGVLVATWSGLAAVLGLGDYSSEAMWATVVLMMAALIEAVSMPWRGVLEGTQRYDVLGRITAVTAVVGAAAFVTVARSGGGLIALAVVTVGISAVRGTAIVATASRRARELYPTPTRISRDDIGSIARYGTSVQVTNVAGAVNVEVDRFIVTGFFDPAVAGSFEIGARIVNLFRVLFAFVLMALFPAAVTNSVERGRAWLDRFHVIVTRWMAAGAMTGAAVLMATATPMIQLLLGQPDAHASAYIVIVAPAYAVNLSAGATGILARVEDRAGRETLYAVMSVVINLALTIPLLKIFGPRGVPLATAIGVVIATIHFMTTYNRITDRPVAPIVLQLLRPLFAAALAGAAGWWVAEAMASDAGRGPAAAAVVASTVTVTAIAIPMMFATGAVTRADLTRLRSIVSSGR
jgi:O-antigen/teichoic acid export membrane protein